MASGAVRGIGKTMAARIVEHFGSDTLDVLSLSPYRLTEISGIGRKKAEAIGMSYAELSDMRELMCIWNRTASVLIMHRSCRRNMELRR